MPLITRSLKGSKLSIEEMDGNLTYLQNLATSTLRDYVQLQNRPLIISQKDRWNSIKEITLDKKNLYIDGPFSLRFTNQVNQGGPLPLLRVWDWDGPLGELSTTYSNQEIVYNERAQISFMTETGQKSSLSLNSFDWTGGSQSGVTYEYKFYQGGVKLPMNATPSSVEGTIAFSDGVIWDPYSSGQKNLNIYLDGSWNKITVGSGATGPAGPTGSSGDTGPVGPTGPSLDIVNPELNKLLTSDGTNTGVVAQSNLTYDGFTFSLTGDLIVSGAVVQPNISSPSISFAVLEGDTTLQNITTVLNDTIQVTQSVVDFDFISGSVYYLTSVSNDFTINVINLPTTDSRAINLTLFLSQGITTFGLDGLQIDSNPYTIKWIGGVTPIIAPNSVVAYTFNMIRSGGNWSEVLGAGGIYV